MAKSSIDKGSIPKPPKITIPKPPSIKIPGVKSTTMNSGMQGYINASKLYPNKIPKLPS